MHETKTYRFPIGPAHPAMANFGIDIEIEGEKVINAKSDPGYLHRGFEKLMEYRTYLQNTILVGRVCVFEPFSYELAYNIAVDKIAGLDVPERGSYIRVMMSELMRISSHLVWMSKMCRATGLDTVLKLAITYRDYILELFEESTGGRVYPVYIRPGGVRWDLPDRFNEHLEKALKKLEDGLLKIDGLMFKNDIFISRTRNVGILKKNTAIKLGATGPVLKACGFKYDIRKDNPYEVYKELDFDVPVYNGCDSYSRSLVRRNEIEESIKIIRQLVKNMPSGNHINKISPFASLPQGEVYSRIEGARGEIGFHIISTGSDMPYRVKIRSPSFTHFIPVLEDILTGSQIADVPVIYWSLDPCADMDR